MPRSRVVWPLNRSCVRIAVVLAVIARVAAGAPLTLPPDFAPERVEGDIQVWSWNIAAASLNRLIPMFNERYPKVSVRVNMSGMNLQSRFLLSLSAGVGAPEVSQLQLAEAQRYAQTLRLTDLTPVAEQYADKFPHSFWDNCVYEGRIYAIPWDMGPCAVFYKRDIFAQYEIDPDTIETWDDYIGVGRELMARSGGRTRMLFLATGFLEVMFEMLLQQGGGQFFDEEGRIAIRSAAAVRALDIIRAILESGISANAPVGHAYFASLRTDTVATYPAAAWFGGDLKDYAPETAGNWGVFRFPALYPGGLRNTNYGGSVLVIPDQCAHKEAAWAYIEYALCTIEAQLEQYKHFDLFPAFLPAHNEPFFDEPEDFYGGQHVRRLFSQDIEEIPPLNRTTDWMEAQRYMRQALSKWVSNGLGSSDAFLSQFEQRLSRRLGRPIAPPDTGDTP